MDFIPAVLYSLCLSLIHICKIALTVGFDSEVTIGLRIPGWATAYTLQVNGQPYKATLRNGYALITHSWSAGDAITLDLPMEVRLLRAHPALQEDCGLSLIHI